METKVAIVTGASRGIGKAIARALADAGLTVIGTATSEAGADQISSDYPDIQLLFPSPSRENQSIVSDLNAADSYSPSARRQQLLEAFSL